MHSFLIYIRLKTAITLMALLVLSLAASGQPGTLLQDFGNGGYTLTAFPGGGAGYHAIALQADGKIIAAGDEHRNGTPSFAIARYNTAGRLDASFGDAGQVVTDFEGGDDRARAVTVQPDGKIVVAGYAHDGSNYSFALVRYLPDGNLDTSFGKEGKVNTSFIKKRNAFGRAIALQDNGKILVAGEAFNGTDLDFAIARYNHNGRPDSSFGNKGTIMEGFSQQSGDKARAVIVQADGKLVIGGITSSGGGGDNFALVRYHSNGQLDERFGNGGKVVTDFGGRDNKGRSLSLMPDGSILLAGETHNGNNLDFAMARYRSDGSLDTSFGNGGKVVTPLGAGDDPGRAVAVQDNGSIVVAGEAYTNAIGDIALVRYQANGSLDTGFGERGDGKVITSFSDEDDAAFALALAGDRLYVAGHAGADVSSENALIAAYSIAEPVTLSVVHRQDGAEDSEAGAFELRLSKALAEDLRVDYTLSGTATVDADYQAPQQPLVLPAGQTSLAVPIAVLADEEVEENETVTLTLKDPAVAGVVLDEENNSATLSIADNDEEQEPAQLSVIALEDAAEDTEAGAFEFRLSRALAEDLTIDYRLSGTATAGTDYEAPQQPVVLTAGDTSLQLPILPLADEEVEDNETVILSLQEPAAEGVVLDQANSSAELKIVDNDQEEEPALLSVARLANAAEDTVAGSFEFVLSKALTTDLTIDYNLSGTATAASDYEMPAAPVVMPAGNTSLILNIVPLADELLEDEESVVLVLKDPKQEGVARDEANHIATLFISDNDDTEAQEPARLSVAVGNHAAEDTVDGSFVISLSKALEKEISIHYMLSGTAVRGSDYNGVPEENEVLLPAGDTTVSVSITVIADAEVEGEESVTLSLEEPAEADIKLDETKQSATLMIEDNDEAEPALLSVVALKDATEEEAGAFGIALSKPLEADLTIGYTFTGSAEKGRDYGTTPEQDQLVLPAGDTLANVVIAMLEEAAIDDNETVVLTLKDPGVADVALDQSRHSAELRLRKDDDDDNDEEETVVLALAVEKEAAEDEQDGAFLITSSAALSEDITISYRLSGTATAGADYTSPGEEVVLPAGQTRVSIPIAVMADAEVEEAETVVLTLEDPDHENLAIDEENRNATLTIEDNDEEAVLLSVVVEKDAAEDSKDGHFLITSNARFSEDLIIPYSLSGTATPDVDYASPGQQAVLKAGTTSVKVTIVVKADEEAEEDETVILELADPGQEGAALDENNKTATLIIEDNDEEVQEPALLSVAKVKEAAEDEEAGAFELRLSRALSQDLSISYSLSGTATVGTDYEAPQQPVVLTAGQTILTVPIAVLADEEVEEDETVVITLEEPAAEGVVLDENNSTASLTIEDNDEEEPALLSVATVTDAAEDSENGAFEVLLSRPFDTDISLSFGLSGTATVGVDYKAPASTITLAAGQTSLSVPIEVMADEEVEGDETVVLALVLPDVAGLLLDEAAKVATLSIRDNDEEVKDMLLSVAVEKDAAEDDDTGYFLLTASAAPEADVIIGYELSGTATAGEDYEAPAASVTLHAGETSVRVPIAVIADTEVEEDETVVITLVSPPAALDEANKSATMTLQDNDEEVPVLLSVAVGQDAAEDTEDGYFVISSSLSFPTDLTLAYTLTGTATAGEDYEAPAGQVVLPAGQSSVKVPIAVMADEEVEEDETVVLSLETPEVAGLFLDEERNTATLIIADNDEAAGGGDEPGATYAVLPNLFTPNGDQRNDAFVLHASNIKNLHWQIFNRHGRLVYETRSVQEATRTGWDGTFNGEKQPEDAYVWILIYEENVPEPASTRLTGSVTLIR